MARLHYGLNGLALWVLILSTGCESGVQQDFDTGLALFRENKIEEALPMLQRAAAGDEGNAETLAWLAETHRRLGNTDETLEMARRSLRLEPQNSFAHLVMAAALFPYGQKNAPYDSSWYHIEQAVANDSTDGNAWTMMWTKEVFEGDLASFRKVPQKLVETGFLTAAALAYGRWELRTLPQGAVLLTNGDMDTFPAQAVQVTEEFRPDVAVVTRGLLNTPSGRRFVREELGVQMPFDTVDLDSLDTITDETGQVRSPADRILQGWTDQQAKGFFNRPIALARTVDQGFYSDYQDRLVNAGAFLLWQPEPPPSAIDTAAIRASLDGIPRGAFSGPWVGEGDRSPIRRTTTKYLARHVTFAAITYAQELIKDNRIRSAHDVLLWADEFERETELGPVYTMEIQRMLWESSQRAAVEG